MGWERRLMDWDWGLAGSGKATTSYGSWLAGIISHQHFYTLRTDEIRIRGSREPDSRQQENKQ